MSENATIIRQKRRHQFVQVPNETVRDARLSWKATGLLCYLLSLPDDWKIRLSHLSQEKKDGRDATRAGLAELEMAGYLKIFKQRDDSNRITGTVWEVSDFPDTENPNTEIPNTGNPTLRIHSVQTRSLRTPPLPRARADGGIADGGGVQKKTPNPKSKTPAPVAAEAGAEAGQEEDALLGVIVPAEAEPHKRALATAAVAAGLNRACTQVLADALAGALAAPEGDRSRLKNRRNPSQWLAGTARAIAFGDFIETAAYLAARAARQARQAVAEQGGADGDADGDAEAPGHLDAEMVNRCWAALGKTRRNACSEAITP